MSSRSRAPSLLFRLAASLAICIAAAMVVTAGNWPLRSIGRTFGICLVYSVCVGGLSFLSLPRLGPVCGKMRVPWNWIAFLTACLALGVVGCLLSDVALVEMGVFTLVPFWAVFRSDVRLCVVITMAFGAGTFLYETIRFKLERAKVEEERARFSSLESRIHPHFLFNTLNSISALIREDPLKAERTVEQLSALLRYSLDLNASRLATLRNEMRIVTDYLDIEKTRFGERLRYAIDVPPALEDLEVPPMAVQTLVENSIKHAVSRSRRGGEVRIAARMVEDRFEIEVSDDGPGFHASEIKEGHGLDSLRSRLSSLFAEDATLRIASAAGRTAVTISLPRKRVLV
jgi:two-component system, LytTR family, sensor histidine kinase AlgZ